jgi:hypothetical protein
MTPIILIRWACEKIRMQQIDALRTSVKVEMQSRERKFAPQSKPKVPMITRKEDTIMLT